MSCATLYPGDNITITAKNRPYRDVTLPPQTNPLKDAVSMKVSIYFKEKNDDGDCIYSPLIEDEDMTNIETGLYTYRHQFLETDVLGEYSIKVVSTNTFNPTDMTSVEWASIILSEPYNEF
jgi:hypothetical protein